MTPRPETPPPAMDRPLDPSVRRRILRRRLLWLLGAAALLSALAIPLRHRSSHTAVPRDRVTVSLVREDLFQDFIAVIGGVEPVQTVFLDATEGGRVEEILLREGARLTPGVPILRLSNDSLRLQIAAYETEVARATNDLRSMRLTLENQQYSNQTQLLELDFELRRLERDAAACERLMGEGGVTRDALLLARETLEKKTLQRALLRRKAETDTAAFASRIAAAEEMLDSMQRNLATNRSRLDLLTLRAPVAGELASLNPELGQVVSHGYRLGTIHVLDAYKIRAEVDEHYIARVAAGLRAVCEFGGRDYPGRLAKVYPEVRAGKFAVDVLFADQVPADLRIGQTTRVQIELGEPQRALLLPRGAFFAATGGQWAFVVDPQTGTARRRVLRLGRQNPACYEVLSGLVAGESVITSDYEGFADREKLVLEGAAR